MKFSLKRKPKQPTTSPLGASPPDEDAPLTKLDRQMVREGLPHHHSTIDHPIAGERCPNTPDHRHRFEVVGDGIRCAACPGWKE